MKCIKLTMIKTSSDDLIMNFVDTLFFKLINKQENLYPTNNNSISHTIGIRVIISFQT